jgi:TonB family protein
LYAKGVSPILKTMEATAPSRLRLGQAEGPRRVPWLGLSVAVTLHAVAILFFWLLDLAGREQDRGPIALSPMIVGIVPAAVSGPDYEEYARAVPAPVPLATDEGAVVPIDPLILGDSGWAEDVDAFLATHELPGSEVPAGGREPPPDHAGIERFMASKLRFPGPPALREGGGGGGGEGIGEVGPPAPPSRPAPTRSNVTVPSTPPAASLTGRVAAANYEGGAGGVASATPDPGFCLAPVYPRSARRAGLEGVCTIEMAIDERGKVTSATLVASSGHDILDQAALKAARSWRFLPARRGGIPVPATVEKRFRFALTD